MTKPYHIECEDRAAFLMALDVLGDIWHLGTDVLAFMHFFFPDEDDDT